MKILNNSNNLHKRLLIIVCSFCKNWPFIIVLPVYSYSSTKWISLHHYLSLFHRTSTIIRYLMKAIYKKKLVDLFKLSTIPQSFYEYSINQLASKSQKQPQNCYQILILAWMNFTKIFVHFNNKKKKLGTT